MPVASGSWRLSSRHKEMRSSNASGRLIAQWGGDCKTRCALESIFSFSEKVVKGVCILTHCTAFWRLQPELACFLFHIICLTGVTLTIVPTGMRPAFLSLAPSAEHSLAQRRAAGPGELCRPSRPILKHSHVTSGDPIEVKMCCHSRSPEKGSCFHLEHA